MVFKFIVLSLLVSATFATNPGHLTVNPGIITVITSKGLHYVSALAKAEIQHELNPAKIKIPNQSGKDGIIHYHIKDIKVTYIDIKDVSITSSTSGIAFHISDVSVHGKAHNHYLGESHKVSVKISRMSLDININLHKDSNGHLILKETCSLSIGHIRVKVSGSSKSTGKYRKLISKYLKEIACDEVKKEIVKLDKDLEKMTMSSKVDNVSEIHYELIKNPISTSEYIEFQHKGEFVSIKKHVKVPFFPPTITWKPTNMKNKMIYIIFTDYFANTASFVYQKNGELTYKITPEMVPKNSKFQLNTDSLKDIFPQLSQQYPHRPMQVVINSNKAPKFATNKTAVSLGLSLSIDLSVVKTDNTTVKAVTIGLRVSLYFDNLSVHSNGNKLTLKGSCSNIEISDIKLSSSQLPGSSTSKISYMVQQYLKPAINGYTEKGYTVEIPLKTIQLVNPHLDLEEKYIGIGSDIKYTPAHY